jgi:hypothetical protein
LAQNDTNSDEWRLAIYDIKVDAAEVLIQNDGLSFFYVNAGAIRLTAGSDAFDLAEDDGRIVEGNVSLQGSGMAWMYELAPASRPRIDHPAASLVLLHPIRPDFSRPWVMRADRVESTANSETPKHGHQGPGMRRLIFGRVMAEIEGTAIRLDPGSAWFESGKELVIGRNIAGANSAFARVLILPAELEGGKTSFLPADAHEASKPRSVTYRFFGEAKTA